MRARIVIFLLLPVICGSYGCATQVRRFASAQPEIIQARPFSTEPPANSAAPGPILAELQEQDTEEENFFALTTMPEAEPQAEMAQRSSARVEGQKPIANKPADPTPKIAPKPDTGDSLLEWVEKDLKKAAGPSTKRRGLEFSNAVIQNARVRYFIDYFSKSHKEQFATILSRSGKYFSMIAKVLREEGVPEELAYLALIESEFSPHAASPAGAAGLWQFVPGTARHYGLRINSWLDERRDPLKSTRAAAAYLKDLHDYFGRWYLAAAAYNAGQGAIDKALQNSGAKDFWTLAEKAKLSEETRNFVPKFVAASLIAANPTKYGLGYVGYDTALEYEEVEVQGNLRLASLADMAGADMETIKGLNPALLKNQTPPGEDNFVLKLPAGRSSLFARAYREWQESEPAAVVMHEVRRGETLFSIARRYGQKVRALMTLNGLTSTRLRVGQRLKIILQGIGGTIR